MKAIHRPPMPAPPKNLKNSERDEPEGHHLADSRRDLRRTVRIACLPPDERPQHAAAVEGIARNQIENSQREIDVAEPQQHGHPWIDDRIAQHARQRQGKSPR